MRNKYINILTNKTPMNAGLFCALLCLVSTQTLIFAHDHAHTSHEKTELCEILNFFGASKDFIVPVNTPPLLRNTQSQTPIGFLSIADSVAVVDQRSRAPPYSLS